MGIAPRKEDKNVILNNGPYLLGGQRIYLKDWEPNFDLGKEKLQVYPIWTNL